MARAEECLLDAELLFQLNRTIGVVNRAYYATFDAARAMLLERGLKNLKTHAGLQSKFSELFIKTGIVPAKTGDVLRQLFELRQTGDYDFEVSLNDDQARKTIELARYFLAEARFFFDSEISE